MFPALVLTYRRLAIREERDAREQFGEKWEAYAERTPRMIARLRDTAGRRGPAATSEPTSARSDG
jgi:hypothetical protein